MAQLSLFPKYSEIEEALVVELRRRGGAAVPGRPNQQGLNLYDVLADHFQLSAAARNAVVYENNGVTRSKWENMVRWARRKLVDRGVMARTPYGLWSLK